MPMINSFGVIGGDERMRYLASSIAADGYPVCAYGFENSGPIRGVAETPLLDLVKKSSVILTKCAPLMTYNKCTYQSGG